MKKQPPFDFIVFATRKGFKPTHGKEGACLMALVRESQTLFMNWDGGNLRAEIWQDNKLKAKGLWPTNEEQAKYLLEIL